MNEESPRYGRILLKLSGEALMGDLSFGIDPSVLDAIASEIASVRQSGVQVGVVMGGGNIFRGIQSTAFRMKRVTADYMGMLATVLNGLALAESLRRGGAETTVMTGLDMAKVAEPFNAERAVAHLTANRIVLFAAGTGNPFFTTDTAAALRALEIGADALLKATKVDGVFDRDPVKDPSAEFFPSLSYKEVLERKLEVMDLTAISMAMSHALPIVVFNLRKQGNIQRVVSGERIGTLIAGERS
jgi:uridylate kinase